VNELIWKEVIKLFDIGVTNNAYQIVFILQVRENQNLRISFAPRNVTQKSGIDIKSTIELL
jgi:hypothetical protein